MPDITLCPHYLVDYPYKDAIQIEDNIINSLVRIFETINNEKDIQLIISEKIYELHQNNYPWNLYEDEKWSGVLNLWSSAIVPELGRAKILSHSNNSENILDKPCRFLLDSTQLIFQDFLKDFGKYKIARVKHEEAIFTHENCCYPIDYKGYLILNEKLSNVGILLNPWLRVYPANIPLPTSGHYKFIPPNTWCNSLNPIRHHKAPYGFIDHKGHIWKMDTLHRDHWDVQLSSESSRGNYLNVTPEGKILERK
ncbi:hypothetical protein QLH32_10390 [Acinetobacter corruptisaponis]|uniref:Uncharacterized protein n=1 Tax=Acinetobacter corruptisaponis TaxID=3045147 RepID=A0ABY8S1W0_9GAMM|nr:hypothetical protein [Acinetobacter sp. KCTC 92772]WHP04477.1 hypothetical protein QLH32_10390 [Acinetobacter sp. KCTC 92772]